MEIIAIQLHLIIIYIFIVLMDILCCQTLFLILIITIFIYLRSSLQFMGCFNLLFHCLPHFVLTDNLNKIHFEEVQDFLLFISNNYILHFLNNLLITSFSRILFISLITSREYRLHQFYQVYLCLNYIVRVLIYLLFNICLIENLMNNFLINI
jgi:hypothetical protein